MKNSLTPKILLSLTFFIFLSGVILAQRSPETEIIKEITSEYISGIWYSDTTYHVTVNVTISSNDTLTIQPGTKVVFYGGKKMSVNDGVILAVGNESQGKIVFTTREGTNETWNGVDINNAKGRSGISKIQYCKFENISSSAEAALAVNNNIADIIFCDFNAVGTFGIFLQSSCNASDIQLLNNSFQNIDDVAIEIYSNNFLNTITIKDNTFSACTSGVYIGQSVLHEFNFKNNLVENCEDIPASFVTVTGNTQLTTINIDEINEFSNISRSSEDPYLFEITNNGALESFLFSENTFTGTIRGLKLTDCNHATILSNTIASSSEKIFNQFYYLKAKEILIDDEQISDLDFYGFGQSNNSIYNVYPEENLTISNCTIQTVQANCLFLRPESDMTFVNITSNVVDSCVYMGKPGAFLRFEPDASISLDSFEITNNTLERVYATDGSGGIAYIDFDSGNINSFLSQGNTYESEADDSGAGFYFGVSDVNSLRFIDDTINKAIITSEDADNEDGAGGFLYFHVASAPDSVVFRDVVIEEAFAPSDGGFASLIIDQEDSVLERVVLDNLTIGDVRSDNGNGGVVSLVTPGLINTVSIVNNQTTPTETRSALSGGYLYLDAGSGPTSVAITDNELHQFVCDENGGIFMFSSGTTVQSLAVSNNVFSGYPASPMKPLSGGALYMNAQGVQSAGFFNNTFSNIDIEGDGGAIFLSVAEDIEVLSFEQNTFLELSAESCGGAVAIFAESDLSEKAIIRNTTADQVQSGSHGGVFYYHFADGALHHGLQLSDNTFTNCKTTASGAGGVLALTCNAISDTVLINNSSFQDCQAALSGGALNIATATAESLIIDGQGKGFDRCRALDGNGGALSFMASSDGLDILNITDINCNGGEEENAAGDGGLFYIYSNGDLAENLNIGQVSCTSISSGGSGGAFAFDFNDHNLNKSVTISQSDFSNCSASGEDASGGAVSLKSGTITGSFALTHSVLSNCIASNDGGGIYINVLGVNDITIAENTNLVDCNAENGNGGAVYIYSGVVADSIALVSNNTSGCEAGTDGGAYYFDAQSVSRVFITGREGDAGFNGCSAQNGSGGAVYMNVREDDLQQILISGVQVDGLSQSNAGENGGGFCINVNGNIENVLELTENTFSNLTAQNNGGVLSLNTNGGSLLSGVLISESTNTNNHASDGNGGAIQLDVSDINDLFELRNCSFSGCEAGENGGALYTNAHSVDLISLIPGEGELSFSECKALEGTGGAINFDCTAGIGQLMISENNYSGCFAGNNGGAMAFSVNDIIPGSVVVDNNDFINNTATADGGVLYLFSNGKELSSGLSFSENLFDNNRSENANGGALALYTGPVTGGMLFDANTFTDCSAGNSGGAVIAELQRVDFVKILNHTDESKFENCEASEGDGGAFAININEDVVDNFEVKNSYFENCSAGGNGGSLWINSGADINQFNIELCGWNETEASISGGALALGLSNGANITDLTFQSVAFEDAASDSNGGAVYISANTVDNVGFLESSFTSCSSEDGNGGGIYFSGSPENINFNNTTFDGCYAHNETSEENGQGGALFLMSLNSSPLLEISNSSFTGLSEISHIGGAIRLVDIANVTIESCLFNDLNAERFGGAMAVSGVAMLSLNQNELTNCDAGLQGGAIWCENETAQGSFAMNASLLNNNSAQYAGGGIFVNNIESVNLEQSRLFHNSVLMQSEENIYGGGLYAENASICSVSDNTVFGNYAINESTGTANGGGLLFNLCGDIFISNNEVRLNEANSGGGICIIDDNKSRITGNEFMGNEAINGGAVCAVANTVFTPDSLIISDNNLYNNTVSFRGGAVYTEHNNTVLFRNKIVRNNAVPTNSTGDVKGSGVYVHHTVEYTAMYNTILDNNHDEDATDFDNGTVYLDASGSSPFNQKRLYLENCTFLDNSSSRGHKVFTKNEQDSVFIINSVFNGNASQRDSLFNTPSVLSRYSLLEGDLFGVNHEEVLPNNPYILQSGTYLLEEESELIDLGDPDPVYNDFAFPPAQGDAVNDPGHTGGRFNGFCSDCLTRPDASLYSDSLIINRYNCTTYEVEFYGSQAQEYNHFEWYVDGTVYITEDNFVSFEYDKEKNVRVIAVATSSENDQMLTGKAWIYNLEIVHDGLEVSYSPDGSLVPVDGDDYQLNVQYPDDCLENVMFDVHLRNLKLPDPGSFNFTWSEEHSDGIVEVAISNEDKDDAVVTFSLMKEYAGSEDLNITVYYTGDDACGLHCEDQVNITVTSTGFVSLEIESFFPATESSVAWDQLEVVSISFNQMAGMLSDDMYEEIIDTDITDENLFMLMDGDTPIVADSVVAANIDGSLQLKFYPAEDQITYNKTYSVELSERLITKCGWTTEPFDYYFTTYNTAIEELVFPARIYPNPVVDKLTIDLSEKVTGSLELISLDGKHLQNSYLENSSTHTIDMEHLSKGVYMIVLTTNQHIYQTRIIKE